LKNNVQMQIDISKIIKNIVSIIIILIVLSISTQLYRFSEFNTSSIEFTRFNLDVEANIPTYISTILLLSCSILLYLIYLIKKSENDGSKFYWLLLSAFFLLMSMDEAAAIHEMLSNPIRAIFDIGGFFYSAWIIPGMLIVVLVLVMFLRFWINLDTKTRVLFALSAAIFLTGAIGFEGIGGFYREKNAEFDVMYLFITTIEETLELTGTSLFIYSLLRYLQFHYTEVLVKLVFKTKK
jgi:hypothetical protein